MTARQPANIVCKNGYGRHVVPAISVLAEYQHTELSDKICHCLRITPTQIDDLQRQNCAARLAKINLSPKGGCNGSRSTYLRRSEQRDGFEDHLPRHPQGPNRPPAPPASSAALPPPGLSTHTHQ